MSACTAFRVVPKQQRGGFVKSNHRRLNVPICVPSPSAVLILTFFHQCPCHCGHSLQGPLLDLLCSLPLCGFFLFFSFVDGVRMERDFACWMRKRASQEAEFERPSSIRVSATCVKMDVGGLTWRFIGYWNGFWQRPSAPGSQSNKRAFDALGSYPNCEVEVFPGHGDRRRSSGVRFPTADGTHRPGHSLVQDFIARLLFPEDTAGEALRRMSSATARGEPDHSLGVAFVKVRDNLSSGNGLSELLDAMYEFGAQMTHRRRNVLAAAVATAATDLRQSSERRLKRMETFPAVVRAKLSKLSETEQLNFAPRLCRLLST